MLSTVQDHLPSPLSNRMMKMPLNGIDLNRAIEAGAEVIMPPMDAFWGARYAQVVDPFGHAWSFAHPLQNGQG
jgi:predicted enzyme related to lactoylglutathione lyase